MVATPIGNLADISLRALHVLGLVDAVACEDTRHTRQMLNAYGLDRPAHSLLALHQHNESQAAQAVLQRLSSGERVAYVSDAGTPAISDPGARLVQAVQAAGHRVMPLPGASSVTTLLSGAGMEGDGFVFHGFLPAKPTDRQRAVADLSMQTRAVVLLEAPHRIEATAQALAVLGPRRITVGRELTKQFEQIVTLAASELAAWLALRPEHLRGEFALLLHAAPASGQVPSEGLRVLRCLLAELPLKSAVRLAADITGEARNTLYEQALALKAADQP